MNAVAPDIATQAVVVDEIMPHAPEIVWRVLTNGALIARWLMVPRGFEAVIGTRFSFQTTPAGAWDGVIHCEVLEVVPQQRLSYSWRSGHDGNVGYGATLDTVVTWLLEATERGTRLRLVHSGFVLPRNGVTYQNMSNAWPKVVGKINDLTGEQE